MLNNNENMEKPNNRPSLHDTPNAQQKNAGHSVLDAAMSMQNPKPQTPPEPPKKNRSSLVMGALFVVLCASTVVYKNWQGEDANEISLAKPLAPQAKPVVVNKPEPLPQPQAQAAVIEPSESNATTNNMPSPFAELATDNHKGSTTPTSNGKASSVLPESPQEAVLEPVKTPKKAATSTRKQTVVASKNKVTVVSTKSKKIGKQSAAQSASKKTSVKAKSPVSTNKNIAQAKPRTIQAAAQTKPKKSSSTTDSDVRLFEVLITQIRKHEKTAQADHATDSTANLKQ